MPTSAPLIVACNGADVNTLVSATSAEKMLRLAYETTDGIPGNIRVGLPRFVEDVYHLPERMRDLLEIASFVYCADRHTSRGPKDALEFHAWARSFHFVVRVRDFDFWRQPHVTRSLEELLRFLSGNKEIQFTFQSGHITPPTNLFDAQEFSVADGDLAEVMLFSGGLDSLTGAVEHLATSSKQLLLVSHRSGLSSTCTTQDTLVKELSKKYPGRIQHYKFRCGLTQERAAEETQRTRFFLYTSIAFALAASIGKQEILVFENGITSLNFPKRQDLMLGRASRTTHPQTIAHLNAFFSHVMGGAFTVVTPYFWKTKTDVVELLKQNGGRDLMSDSVSCSKTFNINEPGSGEHGTHCGGCSQCVDRRFAAFAAGLEDCEGGIYARDFITREVTDAEVRTTLIDYMRQAQEFASWNADRFYIQRMAALSEIMEYLNGMDEQEALIALHGLCERHGNQVKQAIQRMRTLYDDPYSPKLPPNTILHMIDEREHQLEASPNAPLPLPTGSMEVFFSYSHKDEGQRKKLEDHLSTLKQQGTIKGWHFRKIGAGTEWEGQINEHLESAHIILLLVSSSFLASEYCNDIEVARAMQRHEAKDARVIPVILRDCDWHGAPFGKLQALPTDGQPVAGRPWKNQDEAFTVVAKGIRDAVKVMQNKQK